MSKREAYIRPTPPHQSLVVTAFIDIDDHFIKPLFINMVVATVTVISSVPQNHMIPPPGSPIHIIRTPHPSPSFPLTPPVYHFRRYTFFFFSFPSSAPRASTKRGKNPQNVPTNSTGNLLLTFISFLCLGPDPKLDVHQSLHLHLPSRL